MFIGYTFLFFVLINFVVSLEIQRNPNDQFTKLNGNALFTCLVKNFNETTDYVEWCKNNFCTWGRTIRISEDRLRYKSLKRLYILGNQSKGEWNLLIQNVTDNDVGQYKCTVTRRLDKNMFKINSSSASLKIMKKPSKIELNYQNFVDIILDQTKNIECLVENSVPEPIINWFMIETMIFEKINRENSLDKINNVKLIENLNSSFQISTFKNSESLFVNRLSLTGTMDLERKTLIALIDHPLLNNPVIKAVHINLKYPPLLSIHYEPKEPLEEGKTFTFYCKSEKNGDQEKYSKKKFFYLNEKYKFYSINDSIRLKLNRKMNSSLLVCEDSNLIGKSVLNYSMDILYPPKFVKKPEPIVVVNNKTDKISLHCSVDSNPKSQIHWIKNYDKLIHIGEELNLNENFDGEYECQTFNEVFSPITSKVSLISEGRPLFIGKDRFFVNSNKDLDIYFSVLSSPSYESAPICFKMDQNNSYLVNTSKENGKFFLLEDDFMELKMSTKFKLVIKNVKTDDEGFYNCTIGNEFGNAFFSFEIKKKSERFKMHLTLALIIIFSILIVILVMSILVLIYMQRIRKEKVIKSLPSVSDHSGYEQNDKSHQQYQIYTCENMIFKEIPKNLSDDRKIDNSFKKQSNQISLAVEQNSMESISECLKFPPDTQNLIFIDKLKSINHLDLNGKLKKK